MDNPNIGTKDKNSNDIKLIFDAFELSSCWYFLIVKKRRKFI